MILESQPNEWSCTPTAFAMALNLPVKQVISAIGHDGSEQLPGGRKGFHIQECIWVATCHGYAVTPHEFKPVATPDGEITREYDFEKYVLNEMDRYSGVLTGIGAHSKAHHAVAWSGSMIFDPCGIAYGIRTAPLHFQPACFWRFNKVIS